jgi:hypothetical protein
MKTLIYFQIRLVFHQYLLILQTNLVESNSIKFRIQNQLDFDLFLNINYKKSNFKQLKLAF